MKKIRNNFTKKERRLKFNYYAFIRSDWWTKQKEDWYGRHKKCCAKCKSKSYIHLHHKLYPKNHRYLSLSDNSFVALCRSCHFTYHKIYGVNQYMGKDTLHFIKNDV